MIVLMLYALFARLLRDDAVDREERRRGEIVTHGYIPCPERNSRISGSGGQNGALCWKARISSRHVAFVLSLTSSIRSIYLYVFIIKYNSFKVQGRSEALVARCRRYFAMLSELRFTIVTAPKIRPTPTARKKLAAELETSRTPSPTLAFINFDLYNKVTTCHCTLLSIVMSMVK